VNVLSLRFSIASRVGAHQTDTWEVALIAAGVDGAQNDRARHVLTRARLHRWDVAPLPHPDAAGRSTVNLVVAGDIVVPARLTPNFSVTRATFPT